MLFTAGSGYTDGAYTVTGACTPMAASGSIQPKIDIRVLGGAIVDAYPAASSQALGLGIGGSCTFPLTALGARNGRRDHRACCRPGGWSRRNRNLQQRFEHDGRSAL